MFPVPTAETTSKTGLDKIDAILKTRDTTHGDYDQTAAAAQRIKDILRSYSNWGKLDVAKRESIDLIATKLGRIIAGNFNHADHWNDIAGYAKLVSDRLASG